VQHADIPPPQSATVGLHPVGRKLLLIFRPAKGRRLRHTQKGLKSSKTQIKHKKTFQYKTYSPSACKVTSLFFAVTANKNFRVFHATKCVVLTFDAKMHQKCLWQSGSVRSAYCAPPGSLAELSGMIRRVWGGKWGVNEEDRELGMSGKGGKVEGWISIAQFCVHYWRRRRRCGWC